MNEYSTVKFFENEQWDYVTRFVDPETAVRAAKELTDNPGEIVRVIITDDGDCTCFEWIKGKGVVFPTREQLQEAKKWNEDKAL